MMTLFSEYPPNDKSKAPKRDDCCDAWAMFIDEIDGDIHRVWQFLHRWAHRRTPFTARALAEVAEVAERDAQVAIEWASGDEWIARVQPEFPGQLPEPVWMGRLAKER